MVQIRLLMLIMNILQSLDNQAYTSVISEIAVKENATVIIISNNNTGKAIAPQTVCKA